MASNYTQNYGLCQWEPGDSFIRQEFNDDNEKIDLGLTQLKEDLTPLRYNIYNLILQNYYESKYTGWKKALVFDGFLDSKHIAQRDTQAQFLDQKVLLVRSGETGWTAAENSISSDPYFGALSTTHRIAAGYGKVTGFLLPYLDNYSKDGYTLTHYLELYVNGNLVESHSLNIQEGNGPNAKFFKTVSFSYLLTTGDEYYFRIPKTKGSYSISFYFDSNERLAGTAYITNLGGTTAQLTSVPYPVEEDWERTLLYLRRKGGTVTPRLNGADLTLLESREAENMTGEPCTEETWQGPAGSGPLTVTLDLALSDGEETCAVYDYGVLLL